MPVYCGKPSNHHRTVRCGLLLYHEGRCDWDPGPAPVRKAYDGLKMQLQKARVIHGYAEALQDAMHQQNTLTSVDGHYLNTIKALAEQLAQSIESRIT